MTTKDVATRPTGGPLAIPEGTTGLSGEFGQQDMSIPICSLVQPMSQDKGEEGHFWFPDGRSLKRMEIIVLDIVATRALWRPIEENSDGPLCRSADRKVGLTDDPDRVMGDMAADKYDEGSVELDCIACPHYEDFNIFERGQFCRLGYTLLCHERVEDIPFLYFVKGVAVKPVKQRIVGPALQRVQRGKLATPWMVPFQWTAKLIEVPGQKYWMPEILPLEPLEESAANYYAEMSLDMSGRASAQSIEPTEEPA